VHRLRVNGFKAVRVPVSAPSGEPLPDVLATKGDLLVAFEVKAPKAERAYFPREQVEKLFFSQLLCTILSKKGCFRSKVPSQMGFQNG
jgi:Holliday junction resolvase